MAERSGAIEVDGRRLSWRSLGAGPPLLLVNGYAATAADWDPTALTALAESAQVICPDSRGMGGSGLGEPRELTIEAMAEDLERLLDALEIERAAVVGWSMGGFVAQRLASRAPGRVDALVLASTDPGAEATRAAPDVWARLTDHSGTPHEQASRLIALLFPPTVAPEIDRQFGDVVAEARAGLSPAALRAQEAAMDAWHESGEGAASGTTPPVLVLHGDADVVIPPANAEALAACWPGAQVELFAGGGHAFIAQEPQRFANSVISFLRRSRRAPGDV
jgi:pimeloyl-ACP methyl ester carboxylesterase